MNKVNHNRKALFTSHLTGTNATFNFRRVFENVNKCSYKRQKRGRDLIYKLIESHPNLFRRPEILRIQKASRFNC